LYFAYGSNLDEAQMRARCPGAQCVGTAVLPDHALVFDGHSRLWGGAVANVVPAASARVHGLVYRLEHADLVALDRYEGHPHSYTRVVKAVLVHPETVHEVAVYLRPLGKFAVGSPPDSYYYVLRRAYERLGFDLGPLTQPD
jgi:gamma-glutamylcyclotransferase